VTYYSTCVKEPVVQLSLRPWITASIALTGAAFVVAPPAPLSEIQPQHRQVSLKSYDEFDFSQLVSATTTNFDALSNYFSANPFVSDPDVTQGLTTVLTDLANGTANPVTNPLSLLTEGALALFSGGYGFGAATSALYGVSDNVQAALSSGDYTAALNDLADGPTTVLYAALNGYPETLGSGLLSPEFGLLTSPDGSDQTLATGSIYAIDQLENTLAAELSAVGGGDLTTTTSLIGPGTLDLSANIDTILNGLLPGGDLVLPVATLLSDAGIPPGVATLVEQLLPGTISIPVTDIESLLPSGLALDVPIPAVTGTFPTFDVDLSQDLLSVLGSVAPVSADLPTLLTPDPTLELIPLLTGALTDLGLPVAIENGSSLPADLTGLVADLLSGLVP
jgi:hypothetical protein